MRRGCVEEFIVLVFLIAVLVSLVKGCVNGDISLPSRKSYTRKSYNYNSSPIPKLKNNADVDALNKLVEQLQLSNKELEENHFIQSTSAKSTRCEHCFGTGYYVCFSADPEYPHAKGDMYFYCAYCKKHYLYITTDQYGNTITLDEATRVHSYHTCSYCNGTGKAN